ncbi:MAG: fibronectin type III domain-containing protein [Actinobacteria bacterium]|nr:fibronectin type III domain-containing protein [Actinomycetota bacterium]
MGSDPKFVGGVAGVAMPIDFNTKPHSFISSFVWATPQSLEPQAPNSGSIYSFGGTWLQGQWSAPKFGGLDHGKTLSYRLTATGPQGDAHSCVTNQRGITTRDYDKFTCVVGGLTAGVTYSVAVVATNGSGDSAPEDLGAVTTFDPTVTVPTLTGTAVNGRSTTIANLSADSSDITVSNLPPNYMVTVWVMNASLGMSQSRLTPPNLESLYWGGSDTSVLSFVGDASQINYDLSHMTITPSVASESVTVYAIATPNNIIYNPVNGHYYASTLWASKAKDFAGNLAYASQQSLLGLQGYMATPLTQAELTFLNGFVASNTYYGGSDDPAFILDPTTGEPMYQYLYANDDSSTASTSDYQSDPNASFQRWYWVSGPHAGEQFANGGPLSASPTMATGVNGYQSLFCPYEPNDAFMIETVTLVARGCLNDISPTLWSSTMVEFGGMTGDEATGTAEVTSSATFTTTDPELQVPTAVGHHA